MNTQLFDDSVNIRKFEYNFEYSFQKISICKVHKIMWSYTSDQVILILC